MKRSLFFILTIVIYSKILFAAGVTIPGAYGDGIHKDTQAIQHALDSVAARGGGTVLFANGTYLTGPIVITGNNVTIFIDSTATILASQDRPDYWPPGFDTSQGAPSYQNLITGSYDTNITITGNGGTIDGQGQPWWDAYRASGAPRIRLIELTRQYNLIIQNINVQNSPQFHICPQWSTKVLIQNINIYAPSSSPNTDGIDPATCHNIRILNCHIDTGDDNIAIKSGGYDVNDTDAATSNVYISHITCLHGHGISIGSETGGGVDTMTVDSCTFNGTSNGIRIKTDRGNGGNIRNMTYSNITMTNTKNPLYVTCYYANGIPGQNDPAQPIGPLTPYFHDMKFTNITIQSPSNAGLFVGLPEQFIRNTVLNNVKITATTGLIVRNAILQICDTTLITVTTPPRIIYQLNGTVTACVTDVNVEQNEYTVNNFSLAQNYPNPFNPTTVINYQIAPQRMNGQISTHVELKIYDMLGREVATLVNENQTIGNYKVEFNASKLASGIYFYRLNAGNFVETKKMILMK